MNDAIYFSHLYEIAQQLNRESSLPSALRRALEKIVALLQLDTGWVWLLQADQKSVYLAASHNLPPALAQHPERLSGWCYCIEQYLASDSTTAHNVSEITCSRLKKITSGTRDLKFHATISITAQSQKIGVLNVVSQQSQELDDTRLKLLTNIGELIGTAIQRMRIQPTAQERTSNNIYEVLNRLLVPRLEELIDTLFHQQTSTASDAMKEVAKSLKQAQELQATLMAILNEETETTPPSHPTSSFMYPTSPLTPRELEVLTLVKDGFTNQQIADRLFVSERTIKFHVSSILSKLYAQTRTEAVHTAVQRGLIGY